MQFTASTIAFVAALMTSQVSAMPTELSQRAQLCGSTPAASGAQDPFSNPAAATADACMKLCNADSKCLSFAFGLPANAAAPTCALFAVAGAQVPAQTANLVVFDKACTGVPTIAPTTANPIGLTAAQQQQQQGTNQAGNTQTGNQQQGASQGQNTQAQQGKQQKRANNCGAAPTGPATSNPSPLKNDASIKSSADCLALCKTTSGCQSVEFGKTSANGQDECRLFSVPASQLPPPTNGQTFVAFDTGC
ncbi:hypothetical protein K504DRAFT_504372 [Pleomassaria siparia CBS 279.74]|uniref:Apple domain-containing protein n=1 Tax=Pleomassaria siparia CBS 279.74 TaxID=1314801 RepID=A0A6G1K2V4_9PLEO|nr:hypothetical protein K504DRAFT_504372 [Pleomassaria siparia CBS 279.74]